MIKLTQNFIIYYLPFKPNLDWLWTIIFIYSLPWVILLGFVLLLHYLLMMISGFSQKQVRYCRWFFLFSLSLMLVFAWALKPFFLFSKNKISYKKIFTYFAQKRHCLELFSPFIRNQDWLLLLFFIIHI